MTKTNISGIDLNLLPPLHALLTHRNVTHAAAEVGLSQPAMSRALARLRDLFADPLLVRGGRGLVLTPLAQELLPRVAHALGGVGDLFGEQMFTPATTEREFRIAASDVQTILFLPQIMARLSREAPNVTVRIEPYGPGLLDKMQDGRLDFAFATQTTELPPGAMTMPVARDRLVLVMRRGHPLETAKLSIKSYAAQSHAIIAILGDGRSELDTYLASAGITRRIGLVTPHFTAALAAVSATDMITTMSERFARQFEKSFRLILREPPIPNRDLAITLVWSHIRARDPALIWFRDIVKAVAARVYQEPKKT